MTDRERDRHRQAMHRMLDELRRLELPRNGRLDCEGCGALSFGLARRWKAWLGCEDDDSTVTVILCPDCSRTVDE